jgi:hypothetical protein
MNCQFYAVESQYKERRIRWNHPAVSSGAQDISEALIFACFLFLQTVGRTSWAGISRWCRNPKKLCPRTVCRHNLQVGQ